METKFCDFALYMRKILSTPRSDELWIVQAKLQGQSDAWPLVSKMMLEMTNKLKFNYVCSILLSSNPIMRTHFPRSSCSVRDFEQTFRDSTHRCLAEGQGDGPPQDNGETFIIIILAYGENTGHYNTKFQFCILHWKIRDVFLPWFPIIVVSEFDFLVWKCFTGCTCNGHTQRGYGECQQTVSTNFIIITIMITTTTIIKIIIIQMFSSSSLLPPLSLLLQRHTYTYIIDAPL